VNFLRTGWSAFFCVKKPGLKPGEIGDKPVLLFSARFCRVAASPYPAYKINNINKLLVIRRPVQAQRRQA